MRIEHNGISHDGAVVRKDFNSRNSYIYAVTAQAFSRGAQYPLFGRNFFEWPLSTDPKIRAEREWLYQEELENRLEGVGNAIDGVRFRAVKFHAFQNGVIEMENLDQYRSIFERLKQSDSSANVGALSNTITAYGKWTALLANTGIVPECNHCGNVMVKDDNVSDVVLIDFENYSGPIQRIYEEDAELLEKHRQLDKPVDPVTSLSLDIGILSGLKLSREQKIFYISHFLRGFKDVYEGSMELLPSLLQDRRVMHLGLIRAFFYDVTHMREARATRSAVSYFRADYKGVVRSVVGILES
ncbi:MAG: hypothetical protein RLZZ455_313 [Candidatus Parcubacteria bacterium]|jgi:hypothetical protein